MLSKQERKAFNEAYWLNIKKALNKTPDAEGRFIQWISYPTKIKNALLRLKVDGNSACVSFDIQSNDNGVRAIIWEQLNELKRVLENETGPALWKETHMNDSGQEISSIVWELPNVSIFQSEDDQKVIDFFREKLMAFDRFYKEFGEILIQLVK